MAADVYAKVNMRSTIIPGSCYSCYYITPIGNSNGNNTNSNSYILYN